MASQIASSHSDTAPTAERLIEAARRELAQGGLRAMSFRRLGDAVGATTGALTYHLGAKAQVLADVVAGERQRDQAWHEAWLECAAPLARLDPEAVAALLEHYLDSLSRGDARLTQLIWADLMLRAPNNAEVRALATPWLAERREFWRRLFQGRIDEADIWSEAACAFTADEGVHSLAVGENPDYRLLRRMAAERLARRLDPDQRRGLGAEAVFTTLVDRLDPRLDLPGRGAASDLERPGRRQDIALAACGVLLDEGLDAITHRSVGEGAGAPASTVAYHFRAATDLLRAALTMVYLVAQGRAPAPAPDSMERRGAVVVRGTLSIALAAARDPSLAPYAVDLRRLRGENYVHVLREEGCVRIDALDGQTAALVGIGLGALSGIEPEMASDSLIPWLTQRLQS